MSAKEFGFGNNSQTGNQINRSNSGNGKFNTLDKLSSYSSIPQHFPIIKEEKEISTPPENEKIRLVKHKITNIAGIDDTRSNIGFQSNYRI